MDKNCNKKFPNQEDFCRHHGKRCERRTEFCECNFSGFFEKATIKEDRCGKDFSQKGERVHFTHFQFHFCYNLSSQKVVENDSKQDVETELTFTVFGKLSIHLNRAGGFNEL